MQLREARVGDHVVPTVEAQRERLRARLAAWLAALDRRLGCAGVASRVVADVDEHEAVGLRALAGLTLGLLPHPTRGQVDARRVGDLAEVERVDHAVVAKEPDLALVAEEPLRLAADEEALAEQIDGGQLLRLRAHADDLQAVGRADDLLDLGRVELLALRGREGLRQGDLARVGRGIDQLAVGPEHRRRGQHPLDVGRALIGEVAQVALLEVERVVVDDRAGLLVDLVGVADQRDDRVFVELEQVLLDPVDEAGRDLGIDLAGVDPVLARVADELEALTIGDVVADDDVDEHGARAVLDRDPLAPALLGPARVLGVEHAELGVLLGVVGADHVLLGAQEGRRGPAHLLGPVGRVVVVAGDHPQAVVELDREVGRPRRVLVVALDLEEGRGVGIFEAGEERLAGVLEGRRRDLDRSHRHRPAHREGGEHHHDHGSSRHYD